MTQNLYIPPDTADKIKDAAVLEDVIADYVSLKHSGSSQVGDCPVCGGKKKLSVTPSKQVWKCFACELGGKDAISFLQKTQGKTYPEALNILAERYNIIPDEQPQKKKRKTTAPHRKTVFRNEQLKASGIPDKAQKYWFSKGTADTKYELDRYQPATIDKFWNVIPGDDMVLHYLDLDGNPINFKDEKGKQRPLIRVRWANPALHNDKDGKPVKYKSPYKSGSHLWIPNRVIELYKQSALIDTLYILEGEKKADKLCLHDLPAVGIMGISNFSAGGEMPYTFELLIKRCGITRIVFLLDSDWQDLSLKDHTRPVDARPNTFYHAALKFKEYFNAFHLSGIDLDVFLAYGNDPAYKGIDDLLVGGLKGKEAELKDDFAKAMTDREGKGEHINCHNITQVSSYKLRELWHLHSRPAFLKKHEEELKTLRLFNFGALRWRWNPETSEFELAEKILPHEQYWRKIYDGEDKNGKIKYTYQFNYTNVLEFLKNRGFGLYNAAGDEDRYIRMEGKVVEEINHKHIRRFVLDFTRELDEPEVLELLLRGNKQYLGPDKLGEMHYLKPEFNQSDKDTQYLYFQNVYWKITAEEITERPISELPRHIWRDKLIDFTPKYTGKPMLHAERQGDAWHVKTTPEMEQSDIAQFYLRTSNFHWRKEQYLHTDKDGNTFWAKKETPDPVLDDDKKIWRANLLAKMTAAGYLIHDYLDWANMKAVICMDGLESEVGKSEGGTGKGVWCTQFEHLVPVHWINGKRKNLEEDKHLYAGVDERTQIIYFEDVRVNFDFEQTFPGITRGTWVEKKGVDGHKEAPKKHLIDTNHGLGGDGNSFWRRQYLLSFSDYYNKYRRVSDDFGCQLFEEWGEDQWNLFYNWIATCCQIYLRHRLQYAIPQDALDRRNMRQQIGENFIDWASLQYDPEAGILLNHKVEKTYGCERFLEAYPGDRKFVTPKKFKEKLVKYARYAGLTVNPTVDESSKDGRIKSNGKEFIILADKNFDAQRARSIASKEDVAKLSSPF